MPPEEHTLDGSGVSLAIIVARFNELITGKLLDGASDLLKRHGVLEENISVAWVPGAFEIPLVASRLAKSGSFDAIVCLGAIIRGATPHFEYIAAQCSRGIMRVAEETGVPAAFGVLTCDSLDQALERAGAKAGNKGAEAAASALETVMLLAEIDNDLGAS